MKKILCVILMSLFMVSVAGCSSEETEKITMSGSTSMEDLMTALGEAYEQKTGIVVEVQGGGSGTGIKNALSKATDIGNSSRKLKEDETGLEQNQIAIDAIAIVVNPNNPIKNLTNDQIKSIFTGEIKNWNEVGGTNVPIVTVGRESGSGTRDGFESVLQIENECKYMQELNETGAVKSTVASDENAIGYISFGKADSAVKVLEINSISPTAETLGSGQYILQRPFLCLTSGEMPQRVKDFFEFVASDEGKAITQKQGYIPMQE